MGVKINFIVSILALTIAIFGCILIFRPSFLQPPAVTEEKVAAMIDEKTKTYVSESNVEDMLERVIEEIKQVVIQREDLEQWIKKLEEKEKEINQRIETLEEKGRELEKLKEKLTEKPLAPVIIRDIYRITLISSLVDERYRSLKGPDQYVLVLVDGEKVIRSHVAKDSFYVKWFNYQKEVVLQKVVKEDEVLSSSKIEVFLMDENPGEDIIIAQWTLKDAFEMRKLSKDGNLVEFTVEKIEEKIV
ncbi:hypothetical protein IBX65_05505 [Candidatus Aerophobetes bacterium]|nr:hypothetical protein [Candidatus Aerophobetes bacterium]